MLWLWIFAALLIWWFTRDKQRTRRSALAVLVVAWVLGTRVAAEVILWPLESQYDQPCLNELRAVNVKQVIVLTGGGYSVEGDLNSSAFPQASMYRFAGGLELCTQLGPDCRLIFSGSAGRGNSDLSTAFQMQELAQLLQSERMILAEAKSDNTAEHPQNVKMLLDDGPFVLVTSAAHMPRAVRSFRNEGLDPIPYPVDFLSTGNYSWDDLFPSTDALSKEQAAFREYQALVLYTMQGW